MEIIKPGDPNWSKKPKKFTCIYCGCIFIAHNNEYISGTWRNMNTYTCNCPCCDNEAYLED